MNFLKQVSESKQRIGKYSLSRAIEARLENFGVQRLLYIRGHHSYSNLFVFSFSAMVSYNVVVGDTVTKVLIRVTGMSETSIFAHRQVVVLFATVCITIPLCLYRNVARLAKISFLSLVCVGFILLAILIRMGTMSAIVWVIFQISFLFCQNSLSKFSLTYISFSQKLIVYSCTMA